jgi:transcriptional regulator with XRE-family HTH domain
VPENSEADGRTLGETVGDQIAASVARLRQEKRLPYTELSKRLEDLGQPIPVLGLRRIERGARRLDADELAALAKALDVPPFALLFPIGDAGTVEILPGYVVDRWAAAKWWSGEGPFPAQVDQIRDASVPDPQEPARLPFELYREHDRYWAEWRRAKMQAALAMVGAAQDGEERRQVRREAFEAAERAALAAEEQMSRVRRRMTQSGITPPVLRDAHLQHIDGGEG